MKLDEYRGDDWYTAEIEVPPHPEEVQELGDALRNLVAATDYVDLEPDEIHTTYMEWEADEMLTVEIALPNVRDPDGPHTRDETRAEVMEEFGIGDPEE